MKPETIATLINELSEEEDREGLPPRPRYPLQRTQLPEWTSPAWWREEFLEVPLYEYKTEEQLKAAIYRKQNAARIAAANKTYREKNAKRIAVKAQARRVRKIAEKIAELRQRAERAKAEAEKARTAKQFDWMFLRHRAEHERATLEAYREKTKAAAFEL